MVSLTHTVGGDSNLVNFKSAARVPITSLKAHFLPVQEGEGDPSPDNVRPIRGWNEVEVERCGKNLLPSGTYTKEVKDQGILLEYNDGVLHIKSEGAGTSQYVFLGLPDSFLKYIPKGTYTLSGGTNKYGFGYITIYLLVNNKDIEFKTSTANPVTKTLEDSNIKLQVAVKTNIAMDITLYPQLETGSVATEYEPYYSEQIPITFPVIGKNKYEVTALDSGDWTGMGYNDNYLTRINPSIDTTNKTITITTIGSGSSQFQKKTHFIPGTYTFSFDMTANVQYLEKRMTIVCFDKNDDILTDSAISITGLTWNQYYKGFFSTPGTFTIPDTVNYFTIAIGVGNDIGDRVGAQVTFSNIQLELGTTVTSYEEYNSDNTVYGGYVDIAAGEVIATYGIFNSIWGNGGSREILDITERRVYKVPFMFKDASVLHNNGCGPYAKEKTTMSNIAFWSWDWYGDKVHYYIDKNYIYLMLPVGSDDNTEVQFCALLETPIHYPLSKTELQTLLNQNNIWSNTNSNTEISYAIHDTAPIRAAKHQIAAAEPHIEVPAAANIQHFETDMIAPLKECKVYFEPVQEGSGDPSPDNVRTINGWTGLNAKFIGKNWIDLSYISDANSYSNVGNYAYMYTDDIQLVPNTKYRFVWSNYDSSKLDTVLLYVSGTNQYIVDSNAVKGYRQYTSGFTTSSTGTIKFGINKQNYSTIQDALDAIFTNGNLLLQLGTNDELYEPYSGTTLPIDWATEAGIIYGGYIDLIKGKLVQTHKKVTIGELSWRTVPSLGEGGWTTDSHTPSDMSRAATPISTIYKTINWQHSWSLYQSEEDYSISRYSPSDNLTIVIKDSRYSTVADFVAAQGDTEIVYELATPIEYSIDPITLKTLRGTNNIWSNANSPIELSYWKH